MLERPYITFRKLARKNNTDTKDTVKYVFDLSDKFSLWILGLSLASISLLLTKLKEISSYVSSTDLKVVLMFLFISVFCGIFYRIVFIFYYIYLDAAFRIVDLHLSDDEHMDTESTLDGSETFDDLIELNNQFRSTEGFKQTFNEVDDIGKAQMYNNLVAWYVKDVAWAKRNLDFTLSDIAETYDKYLGVNKKKFFKEHSPFKLKFTKNASIVLYFGFMLTFLFALAYFLLTVNIHS